MKIISLVEFLQEIESLRNDLSSNNSILYFRGQSKKTGNLNQEYFEMII